MANISKIKLPSVDTPYNIADNTARGQASAAKTAAELVYGNVENNIYNFLTFKGKEYTENQIKALTSAKVGDFYIASDTGTTWVCSSLINGTASSNSWVRAGTNADISKFVTAYDKTGGVVSTVPIPFEGHPIEDFVLKEEVINNLTSTKTNVPLSAYQGKILNNAIEGHTNDITSINDDVSTLKTDVGSLKTDTTQIKTDITSLKSRTSSIEGEINTINQNISQNTSDISTLKNNSTSINENITDLSNNKLNISRGTMTGTLIAHNNANYSTKQVRNIILSTSDPNPSDGDNGDIWIKYSLN